MSNFSDRMIQVYPPTDADRAAASKVMELFRDRLAGEVRRLNGVGEKCLTANPKVRVVTEVHSTASTSA
jgi:hypothetical protein